MQYVECKNIYVILFTKVYLCNILVLTTDEPTKKEVQKMILVKFKNKPELISYTYNIFALLVTDASVDYIIDAKTGEIIFEN